MSADYIAWIDVETSGLDANKEHLLEVACLVTDTDLNLLDEVGYQSTVGYSSDQVKSIRDSAVPFVQKMHDDNGLWSRLIEGKPLEQVDQELRDYITGLTSTAQSVRVGGNSVRLDLNFLDAYLPQSASILHYRFIDVSTVAVLAKWWKDVPDFVKQGNHRAMGDIRESIEQLRYLREQLNL